VPERAVALEQLRGGRALAGNDVGVVERRHERHAALARRALGERFAVLAEPVVEQHLGAVAERRLQLRQRRRRRHHDHARDPQQLRRERHGLRVVPRRVRHHAVAACLVRQRADRVPGAAELERAHALQVLALQEHARAAGVVELA